MPKKIYFLHFFSNNFLLITCPQALHLQSKKLNCLVKFCVKILFCWYYFSLLHTFMRKKMDPDPDPYVWLMDPDTDPGGPKTCGSCGSGSPTLHISKCPVEAASCLMRVNPEIKVGDHSGHILAVQVVVGHVDIPHTPANIHRGSEQNLSGKIADP